MAVANNANSHAAKPAITHYRITERFQYHNELTIKLETGRTHQIRVHMAHITVANKGQTGMTHLLVPILGSVHQASYAAFKHVLHVCPRLEQFPGDLIEMM